MTEPPTDVLSLEYLKQSLEIKITDTSHDSKLLDIVDDANSEIEKVLTPYLAETPIEAGTEIFDQAKKVAAMYGRSLWYEHNFQIEKYESATKLYESKKKTLVETLVANRTTRTGASVVSVDIKKYPLSPSNIKGLSLGY